MSHTKTDARPSLVSRLRTMGATGWNPIGHEAADRIEQLEAALQAVHDDLLERANTDSDGYKVVAVGNSVWIRVCDALAQPQGADHA